MWAGQCTILSTFLYICKVFSQKDFIYLFIFRKRGRGERNINLWEKQQLAASHMPPTGDLAHNPAWAPNRNWTGGLLVYRSALNPWATPTRAERFLMLRKPVFPQQLPVIFLLKWNQQGHCCTDLCWKRVLLRPVSARGMWGFADWDVLLVPWVTGTIQG